MDKINVFDILKRQEEFIALPRDSRSILMEMVAASDLDDPNNWFEFKRSDALASRIEASIKTVHRRVDDIISAGLLVKKENTSRVRFTQKFLDICGIKIKLTPDDELTPEERAEQLNAPPARDSYVQPDLAESVENNLSTMARKVRRNLMNPHVVIKDGKYELAGQLEPATKVNLIIPKWLHASVKKAAYDHDLTIVDTINTILYDYFEHHYQEKQ